MRIVVKAILTHDDKAILAYYPNDNIISFFGGGIENLEKTQTTLLRELNEELNITEQDIKSISFIGVAENFFLYQTEKAHHFIIYYHVELNSIKNLKSLEKEKHQIKFIDINKIKDTALKPMIQNSLHEYFTKKKIFHDVINDDDIAR